MKFVFIEFQFLILIATYLVLHYLNIPLNLSDGVQ